MCSAGGVESEPGSYRIASSTMFDKSMEWKGLYRLVGFCSELRLIFSSPARFLNARCSSRSSDPKYFFLLDLMAYRQGLGGVDASQGQRVIVLPLISAC